MQTQSYGLKPGEEPARRKSSSAMMILITPGYKTGHRAGKARSPEPLAGELGPNGTLIVDSTYVQAPDRRDRMVFWLPKDGSPKSPGQEVVNNVVALGPWLPLPA